MHRSRGDSLGSGSGNSGGRATLLKITDERETISGARSRTCASVSDDTQLTQSAERRVSPISVSAPAFLYGDISNCTVNKTGAEHAMEVSR
jgi:hypothetical protein